MDNDDFLPFPLYSPIGFNEPDTLEDMCSPSKNTMAEVISVAITENVDLELAYATTYARKHGLGRARGGNRNHRRSAGHEPIQN